METVYKDFIIGVLGKSATKRSIGFFSTPAHYSVIINRFMHIFSTIEKIEYSLLRIKTVMMTGKTDNLGDNDFFVDVSNEHITFDLLWDKSDDDFAKYYPLKIETREFVELLEELKSFMIKYEACQIPGLIPSSKLDTWSCVPNEYVKPEYWDLLKQQQDKTE